MKKLIFSIIMILCFVIAIYFIGNKQQVEQTANEPGQLTMTGDSLEIDSCLTVYCNVLEVDTLIFENHPMLKWSGTGSEYPYDWLMDFFADFIREDSVFAQYMMIKHKLTYYTKDNKAFGFKSK